MKQKVSNKLTYTNLLMALMIFCLHSVVLSRFDVSEKYMSIHTSLNVFFSMAVSTFFYISAVLFYRRETYKYIEVVKKKTVALIVPYLAWNVLLTIRDSIIRKEYISTGGGQAIIDIVTGNNNPVLWFIRVLFLFFLVYPIINALLKRRKLFIWITILTFLMNIIIGAETGYSTVRFWIPIYFIGAYIGRYHSERFFAIRLGEDKLSFIVCIGAMIGLVLCAQLSDLCMYFARMTFPIFFWRFADIFAFNKKPSAWMKQSFFYYCGQLAVNSIALKIYIKIFGTGNLSAFLCYLIVPCIMLAVLAMGYIMLSKYTPRVARLLTGNR